MADAKHLTTGEAAKLLGVSTQTVVRWVDDGLVASFRLPGRGMVRHRRVNRESLLAFAAKHGIVPNLEGGE